MLSFGDGLSGFAGLMIQAVRKIHTDASFVASNSHCVWNYLRLLRIDVLLLSDTVEIGKGEDFVFVATDVLASGYLMQR